MCKECPAGYSQTVNCSCYASHVCLSEDPPCANGGNCSILAGDSNYTCSCAGYYSGNNCTGIIIEANWLLAHDNYEP